ncbi:DUF3052 family protein [Nocardia sp. NPDC057353]|uniref:DUF3052 family protein n=1 Tax=Nocardia sp. NPDC057353 TaxID=3346104 RepID=UPI003636AEDD
MPVEWLVSAVERFGFARGQVVREIGYAEDADRELRGRVEAITGRVLTGPGGTRCPDGLLVWLRADGTDPVELLLGCGEAMTPRTRLWVLTPKVDRPGHLDPLAVVDAAGRAGLNWVGRVDVFDDWNATGLRLFRRQR